MQLPFPWIALLIATGLALVQVAVPALPLLTLLVINEFGAILCLIGIAVGVKSLGSGQTGVPAWLALVLCGIFAAGFAYRGLQLWPESGLG